MFPERSLAGMSAVSVFFEDVNGIDIFIEDTAYGYQKLFTIIFSRLFDGIYRVERVFPLGGRSAVLEEYYRQINRISRPSIFIIDGDLYLLTGNIFYGMRGLYILPFYCIENILIDKNAIESLLDEEDPAKNKNDLSELFNFDGWSSFNKIHLYNLFIEYAVSFVVNPSEVTVSNSYNKFVSDNSGTVDILKINNARLELKVKSINRVGQQLYIEIRNEILEIFREKNIDQLDVVSGKDYIWPLVKLRFKSIVNTRIPDINFKQRLASRCNLSKIQNSIACVAT